MSVIAESDTTIDWRDVAQVLWPMTREWRDHLHGPNRCCPTRQVPYGDQDPEARRLSESCRTAGCLDNLHELLTATMGQLERADLSRVHDLTRFIARTARNEMVEMRRHERVAAGFPAKPTRCDGVPGRVNLTLATLPDPALREWYPVLFRILRAYPFSPGRVSGVWPIDGLTAEKSRVDGCTRLIATQQSRDEISGDIRAVLAIAEDVAGHAWVYDNIISPLLSYRPTLELAELV